MTVRDDVLFCCNEETPEAVGSEHAAKSAEFVTPEGFYRGSSSGFAWIPAESMRE